MLYRLLVLSFAYATVLLLLLVAIQALLGDGTITLDFNRYHEGWLEVGLLTATAVLMPYIILVAIKRS